MMPRSMLRGASRRAAFSARATQGSRRAEQGSGFANFITPPLTGRESMRGLSDGRIAIAVPIVGIDSRGGGVRKSAACAVMSAKKECAGNEMLTIRIDAWETVLMRDPLTPRLLRSR